MSAAANALKSGKIYGGRLRESGREKRREREGFLVSVLQHGEQMGPLGLKRKSVSVEFTCVNNQIPKPWQLSSSPLRGAHCSTLGLCVVVLYFNFLALYLKKNACGRLCESSS